jgi:hypothetical protein
MHAERRQLLRALFFESSSPLKSEADNWFLKELRGRYDAILKFIARHEGRTHGEIIAEVHRLSGGSQDQIGGYLRILTEKYQLIERKLPIFAKPGARSGRYYLSDNFISAWLAALATPVAAIQFQPIEPMVARSDVLLALVEGHALEKLTAAIYEERSRKSLPGFSLTSRVTGYWNSKDTEIDLVACDEAQQIVRLASCKRSADKLVADTANLGGHAQRFLSQNPRFSEWNLQLYGIAPSLTSEHRAALQLRGVTGQDLAELTSDL